MDDLDKFMRLLKEIMDKDSVHYMNPEEIYYACLEIEVIELAGENHLVWLN
jgi:hypothetical protein